MKLSSSHEALCEEPILPSRPKISECLLARIPHKPSPEKPSVQTELIGALYDIGGKTYILNRDDLVYDADTHEVVFDSKVCDEVFDRYEEDLQTAAAIRKESESKASALGFPALEELIRFQLATNGLTLDSNPI
jgi:hypothetical protein